MKLFKNTLIAKLYKEKGATLIELVVTMVILGIAIPAILSIVGQMGIHHFQNESVYQSVSFANTKMEEIVAYKHLNSNWSDNIADFAGTENLTGGFQRTVTISDISSWITSGSVTKDAVQVIVSVSPPIGATYSLTVIFAKD